MAKFLCRDKVILLLVLIAMKNILYNDTTQLWTGPQWQSSLWKRTPQGIAVTYNFKASSVGNGVVVVPTPACPVPNTPGTNFLCS